MRIPRYIVIKLEMVDKDTVKATEITDRCEIYEYEADEDETQTDCNKLINAVVKLDMSREDKFKVIELLEQYCEKCKHYLFTDIDGHYCEHETYGQPCEYEPKDEPQTEYEKYRKKIRALDPHKDWFEDDPQAENPCDGCVCDDGKHLMYCMNCKGIAWKTEPPKDDLQTERGK